MPSPFFAAYYSKKNRSFLRELIVSDLDTAEHLWGGRDTSRSFRNVLAGPTEMRGEIWQSWISSGEIDLSDTEGFYAAHHSQRVEGRQIDRWALYAVLDANSPQLHIHEDVLPEGVERARQGTEACESDMAPIFVGCEEGVGTLLRDALSGACRGLPPFLRFETVDTGAHSVWPLSENAGAQARRALEGAPLFLLDGHHRLAAARENHRLGMGDGRILACICSMARSDTLILPIHRAVHYNAWLLPDAMVADLTRAGCKLTELPGLKVSGIADLLESRSSSTPYCIALHSHATKPLLVELPVSPKFHPALAALPVAALDHGVLAGHREATVIPVPDLDLALRQLALDQAQAAFFLPAATSAQVRAVALSKLKMPRKSTRFVPKPPLGLLCRPWMA